MNDIVQLWDIQMFLDNGAKMVLERKPWHEIFGQIEVMMLASPCKVASFRVRRVSRAEEENGSAENVERA